MGKLVLTFIGFDGWERPVYESDGALYVDVDPRAHRTPEICTKNNNTFDGEPCDPIAPDTELEFIPSRAVW